jgi:thymidylate kinase
MAGGRIVTALRASAWERCVPADARHVTAADERSDRFLCLLGIDGSGKSAMLDALSARRDDIVAIHWSQIVAGMTVPMLPSDLTPVQVLQRLGPYARAAQLCYIAALEYDMMIRPALEQNKIVIVDSYWYKFSAKMRVLGMAAPFLDEACQALPRPAQVLFLDTAPEIARRRKPNPNFFECGGDPTSFVAFQVALRIEMFRLIRDLPVTILDGRLELSEHVARLDAALVA